MSVGEAADSRRYARIGRQRPSYRRDEERNGGLARRGSRREALGDEMHALVADLETMVREGADAGEQQLDDFRSQLASRVMAARRRLADAAVPITDRAADGWRHCDDYVHDRPWTSIGIAAAAGVLLGMLLTRR